LAASLCAFGGYRRPCTVEVDLLALGIQPLSDTYCQNEANNDDYEADKEGFSVSGRRIILTDSTGSVKDGSGPDL